jgi:DNA processing protein
LRRLCVKLVAHTLGSQRIEPKPTMGYSSDERELAAHWLAVGMVSELARGRFRELVGADVRGAPDVSTLSPALRSAYTRALAPARDALSGLAPGERTLVWTDPNYPSQLRELDDPPPVLFVRGALADLAVAAVAIVGSRDASAYGVSVARGLARDLAELGIVVVSGLAVGIDAAAHRGALEACGRTIAVVGSGTDVVYPRANASLREAILSSGAVLSELPPGVPPRRHHFPERNRLISGLALGVIVVEATLRSGSLVTARRALSQGREIFAVPGPITAPRSRGPHSLLKEGGKLVENVDDVLRELPRLSAWRRAHPAEKPAAPGPADALYEAIVRGAATVDDLATETGRGVPEILNDLLTLELRGRIVRGPAGRFVATRIDASNETAASSLREP